VKVGRKQNLFVKQIGHARKLIEEGESRQCVAELLNMGRVTLYRALVD
jgi:Helix-turn-helix domain of resolvase